MGLVEDHEIIGEEVAVSFLVRVAEKGEEESVVEDEEIGGLSATAGRLVEAARVASAGFWGAEVLLAADLHPEFARRLEGKVAQRAVGGCGCPFADAFQLRTLLGCEEVGPTPAGAREPCGTDVVLAPLE